MDSNRRPAAYKANRSTGQSYKCEPPGAMRMHEWQSVIALDAALGQENEPETGGQMLLITPAAQGSHPMQSERNILCIRAGTAFGSTLQRLLACLP